MGFRRPRRLTLRTVALTMGALSIATAVGITPVFAFGPTATCTPRAESKPFAKWGDSADYFLVPNGTFEETGEWQVSGPAGLAEENEQSETLRLNP